MAARPDSPGPLPDDRLEIRILRFGPEFSYTVPSFSVLTVELRQAMMQVETIDSDGEVTEKCIDGFIRSDAMLDRIVCPFLLILSRSCLVPVEEFCREVDVRHLRTFEPGQLLIAWEGEIIDSNSSPDGSDSSSDEHPPSPLDSGTDDPIQSTVTFKVIGVLRDPNIQTLLKEIRDRRELGEDFVVKLIPEPENVADSRAIRFGVNIDGTWRTIGYVVREIVEEIHSAIETNSIVSTEFAWVKYKLWKKAPGYYAAVTITRSGQWSQSVCKARSTFS